MRLGKLYNHEQNCPDFNSLTAYVYFAEEIVCER